MRKIAASLLAAACAFTSATAVFAANQDVYYPSDNSVHISDSNLDTGKTLNDYKTVLIRKTPKDANAGIVENDVVYINQNSSGLGELSSFMLKKDSPPGEYIATFGNYEGNTKDITFEIFGEKGVTVKGETNTEATVTLKPQYKMNVYADAQLQTEKLAQDQDLDKYTKTFDFISPNTALSRIYLVSGDGTKCYGYFNLDISTVVTGTSVSYGIQLFNIDESKKDLNVYLDLQEETK